MRFGLLTQWYDPDPDPEPGPAALPGVLARGLQAAGHEFQVLTGLPHYSAGGYRLRPKLDERLGNVDVRRVALYPNHEESAVRRAANYASFGLSAMAFGIDALRGLDALWVNYSPITVAWPMWAARYGLRIPSVVHVLDLWPDTVLAGGIARNRALFRAVSGPLNAWCKGIYASASSVAYSLPSVGEVLRHRGVPDHKLHHVPVWADEDLFQMGAEDLRQPLGIERDRIVLLYAGALGEAQLSTMLAACARVEDPRFLVLIAGSGPAEGALRDQVERIGLRNVRFLGRLPQDQMTRLMATADLSYIGLRPHPLADMTMPSKTHAALAAGRALVVAATGDVVRTAQESRAAFIADPGDVAGIADVLARACALGRAGLAEMGARGRAYYERTFAAPRGAAAVEALLRQAAGERVAA